MATSLVKVLTIGKSFDLPSDYRVKHLDNAAGVFTAIAQFEPDVIVTSTFLPGNLMGADFELRKRWIHVDPNSKLEQIVLAIESTYQFNIYREHTNQKYHPLISVYTPTYNSGDSLRDVYQSLREQTYPNWEWVVVDDSSTDGTWEKLLSFSQEDHRVRAMRLAKNNDKIGFMKNMATRFCRGVYYVELDHDDMLADNCLFEVKKAFEEHPDVGFVYSNCVTIFQDGTSHRYHDDFWKNRYRWTEYRGKKYLECLNPDIYDRFGPHHTQQFGWFLTVGPNHVRAFRAKTFWELGGYNPNLYLADDWDLFARFFLRSKCYHIDKPLYFYRILDNWGNSTFSRNKSIQDHLAIGRAHYDIEFAEFNRKRLCVAPPPIQDESPRIVVPKSAGDCSNIGFVVLDATGSDRAERCLASIRKHAPGAEIVLVANGVKPTFRAVDLADRVVELETNLGYAAGSNRGAMEVSKPLVCFMNDDALFVDDTPARLAEALTERYPIAAPYSNRAKPPQGDILKEAVPAKDAFPEAVVGLCMMMPISLFRTLNGFDTRFTTYEDDDFCIRARRLGYAPKVVGGTYVEHERHATFQSLGLDVKKIMEENRKTYLLKHPRFRVIAIAKNEEAGISDFFRQFACLTRDWCLLDTGSTDRTVELARSIGVQVEEAEFRHYSQARNQALETFNKDADWIIMLDPDERIDRHTIEHLEELVFKTEDDIFLAPVSNVYPDNTRRLFFPKPFLFRNRPDIRWIFKVHEKLVGSLRQTVITNASIDHMIGLHDDGRRSKANEFYQRLMQEEPYFTNSAYKADILSKWPILDYDRTDDPRLRKVVIGPLVSAIVPTYKRRDLVRRAVSSALAQDYANLEVVVVGDACPELIGAELDGPRVRTINLPKNHGEGGAVPRNYGLMLSAGSLVAYLDDDNEWCPDHVSSLYEAMRGAGASFALSSMKVEGKDFIFPEPRYQRVDSSCILHKKELLRKYGWWKDRKEAGYAHDWEFVKRWVDAKERWVATRRPTLLYNAATSGQLEYLRTNLRSIGDNGHEPYLLTVGVCAIPTRLTSLVRILDKLYKQAEGKPVEILSLVDNSRSCGSKRNVIAANAKGKYLAFVDDDDDVEDDYIDAILTVARESPDVDCIVFDVMVHGYGEPKICRYGKDLPHEDADSGYTRKPNHVMAYRTIIANMHPWADIAEEDTEWSHRAWRLIRKEARINRVLYHYLFDPKSTTQITVRKEEVKT